METAAPVRFDLDRLLCDFLASDDKARNALPKKAYRFLQTIARRIGKGLPEDLLGEVVNQTFENLLRSRPGAFDPQRGGAGTYLGMIVRTAVRQVRTSYAAPGEVTRLSKRSAPEDAEVETQTPPDAASDGPEIDQEPDQTGFDIEAVDPHNTAWLIEVRHDLRYTLIRAPGAVAEGLMRIHVHGEPFGQVAADLGISRFALNRQINRFVRDTRGAA